MRICATCTHLRYDQDPKENRMYRCAIELEEQADNCPGWQPFAAEAS